MTHSVTLVVVYASSGDTPFASVALDVRAGAHSFDTDSPRTYTRVLQSETLDDATHALLLFLITCQLIQNRGRPLFDDTHVVIFMMNEPRQIVGIEFTD